MDFYQLLHRHTETAPQRAAFHDLDRSINYQELKLEVDRLAALMHANGARRGQRIALWMPNCIEWLATFLASAKLGMTVISVNTRFKEHEVGQLISRGACSWLAMWPEFKGLPFVDIVGGIEPALLAGLKGILGVGDCRHLKATLSHIYLVSYSSQPPADHSIDAWGKETDGALVYTTSGTTSAPKLVLHRQAGLIAHGDLAGNAYGVKPESVILLAAPMCGAFGFSTAMTGFVKGATLVSLPVFNAAQTVEQIRTYGVTHTYANNEMIDLLLREVPEQKNPFPSLQYLGFASFAPSMDDLPERALAADLPIAGLYGSSELQALVAGHRLTEDWKLRRLAGGTLCAPEGRVRAVDTQTGVVLAHGEVGHIEIKAPSIMSEYLDNPQATREAISSDGYFRTGDFGYTISPQAFIFQGRSGEHLRLGGFLVNPREIEAFIEKLEGVKAVQVVGSEWLGKLVVVAFVIKDASSTLTEDEVVRACQQDMAKFKVPARVTFVQEFPMVQSANSNKVQRHVLKQMAKELLQESSAVP